MPKRLIALLLALLAGPVFAEEPRLYSAYTTGELVVDAEGRVASVTLDHKDLGAKVMAAFEEKIRAWRFEPVVTEGRAAEARARMHLGLLVRERTEDTAVTLEVRAVRFSEPPNPGKAAATGIDALGAQAAGLSMPPPIFPGSPRRADVGAVLWLLVKVGADGRVEKVGLQAAELMSLETITPKWQESHLQQFVDAAEKATRKWRLPGFAGRDVRVPMTFPLPGDDRRRWVPIVRMPVEVPAWVKLCENDAIPFSGSVKPSSARFRLLSELN
jgi:hypothetical protein